MQSFPVMSGDQLHLEFTVRDNDDALVNLTGGTGLFAIARNPNAARVIDSSASPASATITVVDPVNGRVDVTIVDENTDDLYGDYYYEFKWTDSFGREAVIARGWMSFADNLL